jgi:hypothetical protein
MTAPVKRTLRRRLSEWLLIRRVGLSVPRRLEIAHPLRLLGAVDEAAYRPLDGAVRDIESRIKRLADAGSVDAGSGDVLDRLVDSWAMQQEHEIEKAYLARQTILHELLVDARDRRAAAEAPIRMMEERRRRDVQALREARRHLLGMEAVDGGEAGSFADSAGARERSADARERRA